MFKKIQDSDFAKLESFFTNQQYKLCEYSLSLIMSWNNCIYNAFYSIRDNYLFVLEVEIENPVKKRLMLPLSAPFGFPNPQKLAFYAKKFSCRHYYYVPQDYLEVAGVEELEKYFNIYEQSDYTDYICETSDLASLKGHKYSKKRNLINQFKKKFQENIKVSPIDNLSSESIMDMFNRWDEHQDTKTGETLLECEKKAIKNSLKNFKTFEMRGIGVFMDGKLNAFSIGSQLTKNTLSLNFQKALPDIKGLYQFSDNEFAKTVPPQYVYVNRESDMGKPGLKKAKLSYYPSRIIKSYILELK